MLDGQTPNRRLPFAEVKDSNQFMHEAFVLLAKEFDRRHQKYADPENFHVFHHGIGWNFQRQEKDGFKPSSGELKLQSTKIEIKVDRILANDTTLISDFVRETADRQEADIFGRMTAEMETITKETGNTISIPKNGSLADAYLKMIRTTQAGVLRDGTVSRPTLFLNDPAGFVAKLQCEVAERGPEFQKQIEDARIEQEQQALAREAERLARYDKLE